jgi:sarcosine oxidase gamma subunit
LAVSTTRAAGSGRKRPSVLTSLVASVTHANTSTARCVGPDDCTVTDPSVPSGTRARLADVEPAAGTVTVVASGRACPSATP